MANHDIYVATKNNGTQTTTAFYVDKNDHVVFHNQGTAELTITFEDPNGDGPFCKNGNDSKKVFTVPAGGDSETLKVCKDAGGFAYTAHIAGTTAEDPIVIIEKPTASYAVDWVSFALGAGAGLIVALVAIKLFKGSKSKNPG